MGSSDGTVKQSRPVEGCTVGMSCGAMSLQGHVAPNTAPARPHRRGATGQSHNHRPALAQAGESVIGQFATSVTSPGQHVRMARRHSASARHRRSQAGGLLAGTSHADRKRRHHAGSSDGTIKQSRSVEVYILRCSVVTRPYRAKHGTSATTPTRSNRPITQSQASAVCCRRTPGGYGG